MFFYSFNYWLFMLPALLLTLIAQFLVNSAYRKWSRRENSHGITGLDAARRILSYTDLQDVSIEPSSGRLSDHYDPRTKTLHLSPDIARGQSVASMAIAAHEIGHAMQDQANDFSLRFRSALVPAVNIGSYLGWILIIVGLLLGGILGTNLAWLGVGAFSLGLLFALVTLPLEFNASARGHRLLIDTGLISTKEDDRGVKSVLNAAALTYVAALATAALQLLYYISLVTGSSRRR
jgi:Zn-dependent membrane protease YugP